MAIMQANKRNIHNWLSVYQYIYGWSGHLCKRIKENKVQMYPSRISGKSLPAGTYLEVTVALPDIICGQETKVLSHKVEIQSWHGISNN